MSVQMQRLILDPCGLKSGVQPSVIIIDGLDECGGHQVRRDILRLFHPPLKFLIASRPEPHIREAFEGPLFAGLYHPFDVEESFMDVRKYLCDDKTMASVPLPWPSNDTLDQLVEKSSGYFIYASTVIKFIDDRNFRPTERLQRLQECPSLESPFNALDQLYSQILSTVPARPRLLSILRALPFFNFELRTSHVDQLLELEPGDVQLVLRGLHSIISVPEGDSYIKILHASFQDFLNDPRRAPEFYIGGPQLRFSYSCDDPTINRAGIFVFSVHSATPIFVDNSMHPIIAHAIGKIPPLAKFIPLIRLINPMIIFFGFRDHGPTIARAVLNLLENTGNPPADLVELWEEYEYMHYFQTSLFGHRDFRAKPVPPTELDLLYKCPLLLRIFQAHILNDGDIGLIEIHILLDVSWNDLRAAVCSLRALRYPENIHFLRHFVARSLFPESSRLSTSLDLARGYIHLLKDIDIGRWPQNFWPQKIPWGQLVRSSPRSPELIQDIREYVHFRICHTPPMSTAYHPINYYNVLQWLKVCIGGARENLWEANLISSSCGNQLRLSRNLHRT
ncbi:hypothetical protein B0H14DRAFT_2718556 [Mycena olivaceomarginata]|nr:hypothetical protein B0H14DRAFT_2718556 [Mycena olivaceomarginata]